MFSVLKDGCYTLSVVFIDYVYEATGISYVEAFGEGAELGTAEAIEVWDLRGYHDFAGEAIKDGESIDGFYRGVRVNVNGLEEGRGVWY
jgi:hypothetical protein